MDAKVIERLMQDFIYEFGHAKLAEDVDTIFAVTLFHSGYEVDDPDFVKRALMLRDSTDAVCDVWVNDLVSGLDPGFAREDVKAWIDNILSIVGLKPDLLRETQNKEGYWHHAIGYALNIALVERNELKRYFLDDLKLLRKALAKILGEKYLDVSERLSFLLRNLSSLPESEGQAVLLYEANVQKVKNLKTSHKSMDY